MPHAQDACIGECSAEARLPNTSIQEALSSGAGVEACQRDTGELARTARWAWLVVRCSVTYLRQPYANILPASAAHLGGTLPIQDVRP